MVKNNILLFPFVVLILLSGCQNSRDKDNLVDESESSSLHEESPNRQKQQENNLRKISRGVSDKDLKRYVEVDLQIRKIQDNAQQEMIKAIEDSGISLDEYRQYLKSQNRKESVEADPEIKQHQLDGINDNFSEIDQKVKKEMTRKVSREGLSLERYQEIAMAVRADPKLKQQVKVLVQEKQAVESVK